MNAHLCNQSDSVLHSSSVRVIDILVYYLNAYRIFYPHMPIGKVWIYRLLSVFCVCLFVRLRISPARIELAASNFAQWFIGALGRSKISHYGELCSPRSPKSDQSDREVLPRVYILTPSRYRCAVREISRGVWT